MSRLTITITGLTAVLALAVACSQPSPVPTSPTSQGMAGADAAADGSTLKADPPVPVSPINNQQAPDAPTLTARRTAMSFDGNSGGIQYHFELYNDSGVKILDSGLLDTTSFPITIPLAFKARHAWRVRAEYQNRVTAWSEPASFISFEGGYIRDNEVYDPLYNGFTIGEPVGPVSFAGDAGIRLDTNFSYVRYAIPVTITSGEFSAEITGLAPNQVGDKSKVFSMSTDSADFITDPYRFDVQYRGLNGFPPNAITFRAIYGDGENSFIYEPASTTRFNSIYELDPNTVYFWKATWSSSEVRVLVREGGINGRNIYEVAVATRRGTYNPTPHYAYLGAPPGRGGAESASVPGIVFRKVWIGARPRPAL